MDASPTTAPAPGGVLGTAGARVPFRCRERDVSYDDALRAMALRGTWDAVVDAAGRGEQALARTGDAARAELGRLLPASETALRRRLRLTAADEYVAWLAGWGLTVADCREHLLRRLAHEADPRTPGPVSSAGPSAVRAHVVLDGVLDDAVQRLATDAALADADPSSTTWLADVVRGADVERSRAPAPDAVASVVAEHAVDWTQVEATVVVVADDDVARELLLCVQEQHAPLTSVAADVGLPAREVSTTLDALDPWLEPALLGAAPGALLGPLLHETGRAVVQVLSRSAPSALDDSVLRRAADVLLERRAAVAMSTAVRWNADD